MLKKNSKLNNLLKTSLVSVPLILSSNSNADSGSLYWTAPTERMNGNPMDSSDIKEYIIYKNIGEGWHFTANVPQDSHYTLNGSEFEFPFSYENSTNNLDFKLIACDTNNLCSNPVIARSLDSETNPSNQPETTVEQIGESCLISSQLKEYFGNFDFRKNEGCSLEVDSFNNHRDGFFMNFASSGYNGLNTIKYDIDALYEGKIHFNILSGNHWYSQEIDLEKGVNQGELGINNFLNSSDVSLKNGNLENIVFNSFAITGEDNHIKSMGVWGKK